MSKNIPVRDAAIELAKICGVSLAPAEDRKPIASTQQNAERKGFDAEKYAAGLDPSHTALEPLGVSPETYRSWKAGYSPAGVNRGRLALPVAARDGTIVGYCGRGVTSDQQPNLIFPNGLTPTDHIFGADRVKAGELILVRDPVDVLTAYENGIENVVSFLTESVSSAQLQYLSALMDEAHVETLVLF